MKLVGYQLYLLTPIALLLTATAKPVMGKEIEQSLNTVTKIETNKNNDRQKIKSQISTSATDLLTQNNLTRVTGIEIEQTDDGLQIILKTARGERLVPLILPEGNSLAIDILDATLGFELRNGFTQKNPAPGISQVTLNKLDDNSIRLTVTGETQTPSAEIIPGKDDLVLSISPEERTTEQTDEEIEVIATGEAEDDDYYVPEASSATRTDAEIRDIPQSIQVIPQEVIKQQQAVRLEELVTNVSGVISTGNQDRRSTDISIRGFNQVPILRDGFRLYSGDFQGQPEVANLESVEILKGPASVLYGEIEPGGLINTVTKKPLAEPYYDLQLQFGNRSLFRPSADLSGALTENGNLKYRLNTLYRTESSFRDYDSSFDRLFIAPTLDWEINDKTDLSFNLKYIKDDDPADFGTVIVNGEPADIPPERITNNPDDTIENTFLNTGYTLEHRFNQNWKFNNAFRYIVNDYNYGGDNEDILALPFEIDEETVILTRTFADQERQGDNFTLYNSINGKFATGKIQHNLLFGIDLSRSESLQQTRFDPVPESFSPLDIFNPVYDTSAEPDDDLDTIGLFNDDELNTNRLGIYVQDKIDLLDNLILLAGLRYDVADQTLDDKLNNIERSQNNDDLTPRIGIVYQPIEPISLYGSYAQSFEPNTEDTTVDGEFLEPESGEGFEFGVKGEIVPNRLAATVAYFNITKSNVATQDPDNPFSSVATGEQESQGVELDLSGEILPGWNIITSYAYIDAEVTEDNDPAIIGSRLTNIPEHSASLWTTYEIQQGSWQGLGFGGGFTFVGERQGGLPNSFSVDSYFLTNAALFYNRKNWQARLNFDNIFDVEFIEAVGESQVRGVHPGEPFTVRGSIAVQF